MWTLTAVARLKKKVLNPCHQNEGQTAVKSVQHKKQRKAQATDKKRRVARGTG